MISLNILENRMEAAWSKSNDAYPWNAATRNTQPYFKINKLK